MVRSLADQTFQPRFKVPAMYAGTLCSGAFFNNYYIQETLYVHHNRMVHAGEDEH